MSNPANALEQATPEELNLLTNEERAAFDEAPADDENSVLAQWQRAVNEGWPDLP